MYLSGVFLCLWVVLEGILNPITDGKYCWYQMVVCLARRTPLLHLKLTINSPWETISGFNLTATKREKRPIFLLCSSTWRITGLHCTHGCVTYSAALRCFDTVFRRPYRCFSIALKVILFLFYRYKLFTSDCLWNEVCQNAVFSKIDITMTKMNKKIQKSIKSEFSSI